jgi:polar amino acid transport system permease protein
MKIAFKIFGVVVVLYFILSLVSNFIVNPNWHWDIVGDYILNESVIDGVIWTLILTVSSMILAIILAIGLALMRISDSKFAQSFSYGYIWFFRGTPVYTQLIFWGLITVLFPKFALGVPFTDIEFFSFDSRTIFTALVAAILGLALNESAYLSEIFRSGLLSVSKGQHEAGASLGLSKMKTMLLIVAPQSLKVIIPPTGNEAISMLKTTSLVVAVPFTMELTYIQSSIANHFFLPVPLLIVAALWYLFITTILMIGQYFIEKKFGKGLVVSG